MMIGTHYKSSFIYTHSSSFLPRVSSSLSQIMDKCSYSTDRERWIDKEQKVYTLKDCTLHQLTLEIDLVHSICSHYDDQIIDNLTVGKVNYAILSGTFRFSTFYLFKKKELNLPGLPRDTIPLFIEPKDIIVDIALGGLLNRIFTDCGLFHPSSFSSQKGVKLKSFFDRFADEWPKVDFLFVIDLYNSMSTIDRSRLLRKLRLSVVKDEGIYSLLLSFLSMPILDNSGNDWSQERGIHPCTFSTTPLLNYYLDDLDREFEKGFPYIKYARYNHYVFFGISNEQSKGFCPAPIFQLLEDLSLVGNVEILRPGKSLFLVHLKRYISLDKDGKVKTFTTNEDENQSYSSLLNRNNHLIPKQGK